MKRHYYSEAEARAAANPRREDEKPPRKVRPADDVAWEEFGVKARAAIEEAAQKNFPASNREERKP